MAYFPLIANPTNVGGAYPLGVSQQGAPPHLPGGGGGEGATYLPVEKVQASAGPQLEPQAGSFAEAQAVLAAEAEARSQGERQAKTEQEADEAEARAEAEAAQRALNTPPAIHPPEVLDVTSQPQSGSGGPAPPISVVGIKAQPNSPAKRAPSLSGWKGRRL